MFDEYAKEHSVFCAWCGKYLYKTTGLGADSYGGICADDELRLRVFDLEVKQQRIRQRRFATGLARQKRAKVNQLTTHPHTEEIG